MNRSRTLTIAAVVALVGMLAFPMAATAATDLTVNVEQNPDTGGAVVTVVDNETAVENATVTVTSDANYSGTGEYTTNENGTVELAEPNETVSVTINASSNNTTASTQTELVPLKDSLDVSANQSDDGSTTVTVTQYDDPVENASVEVGADDAIAGNYTTDENGTVTLEQPEDDVNATVVATDGNRSAETVVALSGANLSVTADQRDDGVYVTVTDGGEAVENATVEVKGDDGYAGTGTYATDGDGEVVLPLSNENVTVEVTATADNESATTTADLTVDFVDPQEPFGLAVSQFVSALRNATVDGPPGQVVSDFVTSNNPGHADEAPGHSGDAPGHAGDSHGQSGDASGNASDASDNSSDAPGHSGDAPGHSGDNGDSAAKRNASDDAGPDAAKKSEDEGDDQTSAKKSEDEEGDDQTSAETSEDEEGDDQGTETETTENDDANNGSGGDDGNDGGAGGSGDAPGNSGNAPGHN